MGSAGFLCILMNKKTLEKERDMKDDNLLFKFVLNCQHGKIILKIKF